MRLASLAMYASPPPVAAATARLWAFLRDALRAGGMAEVPESLDDAVPYHAAWLRPDLLLAQACGYPYVSALRGKVRLVATPVYGHPGCDGPSTCSFLVVHRDNPAIGLEDLRASRAAVNQPDSNSGANLLRAAIAPLAREGRFFDAVLHTGGHQASIDAVAAGRADVAAIDCVTFGNIARFEPDRLAQVRVLSETARGPGLPFITRGEASDAETASLRRALKAAIDSPALQETRDTLSLKDFALTTEADYETLATLEAQARRLGYPVIA